MESPQQVEESLGTSQGFRVRAGVGAQGVSMGFTAMLTNEPDGGVRLADSAVSVSTGGRLPQLSAEQLVKEAHNEQREYAAEQEVKKRKEWKKKSTKLAAKLPSSAQKDRLQADLDAVEQHHPGAVDEIERNMVKQGKIKSPEPREHDKVELKTHSETGAHFWKRCAEHAGTEKLETTEYELRITTEIRGATQTDGRDSDLSAVLGPKRTQHERVKVVTDLRFELHDRGLVCINETRSSDVDRSWQLDQAIGNRFPLNASNMGRKRYTGFEAAKLRAVVITSFQATQYTFNEFGDKHSGETPLSAEMQSKLQDVLQCGFAFTQSKGGHVLSLFHRESASKQIEHCIKVKSSIAELFESYYLPNGEKQYTIDAIQSGSKTKLNVTTDHYYDGRLASVCTDTARRARESFLKAGDLKVKSLNMRRGTSRCCTSYSMHGELLKTDCTIKEREAASGAAPSKLTQVRRRRTRSEKTGSSSLPNTVLPKRNADAFDPDEVVLLQESSQLKKFDWDAVWGQKSWTDSEARSDTKDVDVTAEVGGPFLGERDDSASEQGAADGKSKRPYLEEQQAALTGAATISVMRGTTQYKLRRIKSEPIKGVNLLSQSDVLLDLSSAWGGSSVSHTLPGIGSKRSDGSSQLVTGKTLVDAMMQLKTSSATATETLKSAFKQQPSLALSASKILLRGECKEVAEDAIGVMGGAGSQDALNDLLSSPTYSAIAAAASHQISKPEPELLEALVQCGKAPVGEEPSHSQCTCLLAAGHHAHKLYIQHDAEASHALAEHIWTSVKQMPHQCAMAALANAGPASSHRGAEVMKLAVSHPHVSIRSLAVNALQQSRHPEIDHFLQSRVGSEHPVVQSAAIDALGSRNSGPAAETAIRKIHSRLSSGQTVTGAVKSQLDRSMNRRLKNFHSPAAEDLVSHLSGVEVLLQTGSRVGKEQLFNMIREINKTEVASSFVPTALMRDELEQEVQDQALKAEVDGKYLAKASEEITRQIKPGIVRSLKRQLKRELMEQTTNEHKVHMYAELNGRMKLKSRLLKPKMEADSFSKKKQAKVLDTIRRNIKSKLLVKMNKGVKEEVALAYKIREVEDLPQKIQHAVQTKVSAVMARKYHQAAVNFDQTEIDPAENSKKKSAAAFKKISADKCLDYDTTKKSSCQRGEQSCFIVDGKSTGCIGAGFFNTVDWSYIDGYRVEARGGFIADLDQWSGELVEANTAGMYKGEFGKEFVEDTYLRYFDFETFSHVYLYRSTSKQADFSEGDSCRGFQVPKAIKQVAAKREFFHQEKCYGLADLGALCGSTTLAGKIGADFGLNVVQPALDTITAYAQPHATISLQTSLRADILGFELYAKGSTTLFSGKTPVSGIFSITKFKGGFESRQALRLLSGSLKVGLKGPGMKRKAKDDIPKSILKVPDMENASKIVSVMKREYDAQLGEGKLPFDAPICLACTNWQGPKVLSAIDGVKAVGLVDKQDVPGRCGPNGRGASVPMPDLPLESTEARAIEEKVFDPSKVNPMLADSPEVALQRLKREKHAEAIIAQAVKTALAWQTQSKQHWQKKMQVVIKAKRFVQMSEQSLKVQRGRVKLITKKHKQDKLQDMGFLSKEEYDDERVRLKASKMALETAETEVQHRQVKAEIAHREVKERTKKLERRKGRAKTADLHVKIANDAFVLARSAEATLQGKDTSVFKQEVLESRAAVKEINEKQIQHAAPLHENIGLANKLLMERREKVRRAQRQENQAVDEQTQAENALGQERIYKQGAQRQVANERKGKGKGMVMEYIWQNHATASIPQALEKAKESTQTLRKKKDPK